MLTSAGACRSNCRANVVPLKPAPMTAIETECIALFPICPMGMIGMIGNRVNQIDRQKPLRVNRARRSGWPGQETINEFPPHAPVMRDGDRGLRRRDQRSWDDLRVGRCK